MPQLDDKIINSSLVNSPLLNFSTITFADSRNTYFFLFSEVGLGMTATADAPLEKRLQKESPEDAFFRMSSDGTL